MKLRNLFLLSWIVDFIINFLYKKTLFHKKGYQMSVQNAKNDPVKNFAAFPNANQSTFESVKKNLRLADNQTDQTIQNKDPDKGCQTRLTGTIKVTPLGNGSKSRLDFNINANTNAFYKLDPHDNEPNGIQNRMRIFNPGEKPIFDRGMKLRTPVVNGDQSTSNSELTSTLNKSVIVNTKDLPKTKSSFLDKTFEGGGTCKNNYYPDQLSNVTNEIRIIGGPKK
jgi:hypothetical protein